MMQSSHHIYPKNPMGRGLFQDPQKDLALNFNAVGSVSELFLSFRHQCLTFDICLTTQKHLFAMCCRVGLTVRNVAEVLTVWLESRATIGTIDKQPLH